MTNKDLNASSGRTWHKVYHHLVHLVVNLEMSKQHDKGGRGRKWRPREASKPHQDSSKKNLADVDTTSPVIAAFLIFQKSLDQVHDKHERLVKLSRDITIESKRIIFLLHRVAGIEQQKESTLAEAAQKLEELRQTKWRKVAEELHNEDPHRFHRAYSPGLQEYIECVAFFHYIQSNKIITIEEIQKDLIFHSDCMNAESKDCDAQEESTASVNVADSESSTSRSCGRDSCASDSGGKTVETPETQAVQDVQQSDSSDKVTDSQAATQVEDLSVLVPPNDWMLGIADLTGELMRYAITRIGKGDRKASYELCNSMRVVHDAFLYFGNCNRELPRKLFTLRQSIQKVETACYTLLVRGSEVPEERLADVVLSSSIAPSFPDVDEDYPILD